MSSQEESYKSVINAINDLTGDDPEIAHGTAEDIIMNYLRHEGYSELADAFDRAVDRCGFWYAQA